MDALQQRIEIQAFADGGCDHDLAIDHTTIGQRALQRFDQLGEVSIERLLVATGQHHIVAIAKHDASKAIPLGFVMPFVANRNGVGSFGQHR